MTITTASTWACTAGPPWPSTSTPSGCSRRRSRASTSSTSAFGVRYPFGKYDQLFVPEFNAGAMENAGAVTFREEHIFRSRVTRYLYERRCETLLHEMAHMWFGDLVTMRWWDDLWLNESFATWASVVAQVVRHRIHLVLDDVRERGEVLGVRAGPAALHPPDRRGHGGPGRRRGELRRHHLRQGRERTQAARRVRRLRAVPGRAAGVLRRARVRQRHPGGPADRTGAQTPGAICTPGPPPGWRPPG